MIWVGEKISPPQLTLETDKNSQMPYVVGKDDTESFDLTFWFTPCPHPRFARGISEQPPIV